MQRKPCTEYRNAGYFARSRQRQSVLKLALISERSPESQTSKQQHRCDWISMITMTWPQYRRRQCSVGNWIVKLSPTETELLSTLLIRYPNPVTITELVEAVYPDPDAEPEYPEVHIVQRMCTSRARSERFALIIAAAWSAIGCIRFQLMRRLQPSLSKETLI